MMAHDTLQPEHVHAWMRPAEGTAQVIFDMQRQGWNLLCADASPKTMRTASENSVHAVLVGKLSRHPVK